MSEMVDRIARALYEADSALAHVGFVGWGREPESETLGRRPQYRRRTLIAINAMREPTQAMIDEVEHASRVGGIWTARSVYQAMIDEALR